VLQATKHEQGQANYLVKYVANVISSFKHNCSVVYEISKGKVKANLFPVYAAKIPNGMKE
jgi:hypothetical protein